MRSILIGDVGVDAVFIEADSAAYSSATAIDLIRAASPPLVPLVFIGLAPAADYLERPKWSAGKWAPAYFVRRHGSAIQFLRALRAAIRTP